MSIWPVLVFPMLGCAVVVCIAYILLGGSAYFSRLLKKIGNMDTQDRSVIRFVLTKPGKLILVLLTFGLALVVTALSGGIQYLLFIPLFPSGLLLLIPEERQEMLFGGTMPGLGEPAEFLGILLWPLYIGLALSIVGITNRRLSSLLYLVFVFLLIANIAGCRTMF